MSRYQALCIAIEMCESARKLFSTNSEEKNKASEVIRELQDVFWKLQSGKLPYPYKSRGKCGF